MRGYGKEGVSVSQSMLGHRPVKKRRKEGGKRFSVCVWRKRGRLLGWDRWETEWVSSLSLSHTHTTLSCSRSPLFFPFPFNPLSSLSRTKLVKHARAQRQRTRKERKKEEKRKKKEEEKREKKRERGRIAPQQQKDKRGEQNQGIVKEEKKAVGRERERERREPFSSLLFHSIAFIQSVSQT